MTRNAMYASVLRRAATCIKTAQRVYIGRDVSPRTYVCVLRNNTDPRMLLRVCAYRKICYSSYYAFNALHAHIGTFALFHIIQKTVLSLARRRHCRERFDCNAAMCFRTLCARVQDGTAIDIVAGCTVPACAQHAPR
jgi:hypothetical protein